MNKRKSFGIAKELERGISETINTTKNNVGQLRYEIIPLSRVNLDPTNPRELSISLEDIKNNISDKDKTTLLTIKQKDELEKLHTLAQSIKKVGVRHAIEVYKEGCNYKVISGERRVLASHLANKVDIQARILEHKPSDVDLKLLQWIENIERSDLNLWERINNVMQLDSSYEGQYKEKLTAQKLSEILGCSRQHSTNLLSVTHSDNLILEPLRSGKLRNLEKTAFLARILSTELKKTLLNACLKGASLEQLKEMSNLKVNKEERKHVSRKGRGHVYVNLGRSNNVSVVKYLIEAVLHTEKYSQYSSLFDSIEWSKSNDVSKAFKTLLNIINENEIEK